MMNYSELQNKVNIEIPAEIKSAGDAAKAYTDEQKESLKNELLNGAGPAYDSLRELGELIDENTDALQALEEIATNKVDKTDLSNYYTKAEIDQLLGAGTEGLIYE